MRRRRNKRRSVPPVRPEERYDSFPAWLAYHLGQAKAPPYVIAERAGVANTTVYRILRGSVQPLPRTVVRLARLGLRLTDEEEITRGVLLAMGEEVRL